MAGLGAPETLTCLLVAALQLCPTLSLDLSHCDRALGMESGEIADSQISVSSSHNENSVGPQSARIRTELKGGAWCPFPVITDHVHEYVQVDLARVTVITAAETQGRFGNGNGVEWAESYLLQYWRPTAAGGTGWRTYQNASGHTLMDGNMNTYLAHRAALNPPIIASRVRFVPRSTHPRTVCMRVELHGCSYTEGVDSYAMNVPDPSRPDLTYDGVRSGRMMEGGLGQLADGHLGADDITKPEWVGWKTAPGKTITIVFHFSSLREVESASFHISNYFTAGVKMFSRAELYFSLDGTEFGLTSVTMEPEPDRIFEDSRLLEVALHRQVARAVRIEMTSADQWLLLSEVSFASAPSTSNITQLLEGGELLVPPGQGAEAGGAPLAVILGVLGLVLLLLSALVGYVVRTGRRRKVAGGGGCPTPLPLPLTLNMKDLRLNMNLSPSHGYQRAESEVYAGAAPSEEDKTEVCADGYRVVRLNSEYNTLNQCPGQEKPRLAEHPDATYEYAVPVDNSTPPPPFTDCAPGASSFKSWENPSYRQSPSNTTSSGQQSVCNITDLLPAPPPIPPPPRQPPACGTPARRPRLVAAAGVQGVTGCCVWDAAGADVGGGACVEEIGSEFIQLREKIGEGRFGEVHACEMHFPCSPDGQYQAPSRLATARFLRASVPAEACERLRLEADALARVSDPHVTRLLGVCTMDDRLCLLVEYTENGDLNQFLRKSLHNIDRELRKNNSGSLVYMAAQVAAGMRHLESLGIVHRDLASRNCLVGHNLKVKVGDLGPGRLQYEADYASLSDGRVLPLRWMAPEAVFTEEISPAADVWSFGVTLWEMLTWCRLQPLAHLPDPEVIERLAGHHVEPFLQQPNACPRELFDLMLECWRQDPGERPAFSEIHMFLQRKSIGFDPSVEHL